MDDCRPTESRPFGFDIDPWLGITFSAYRDYLTVLGVVVVRWNSAEIMMRMAVGAYLGFSENSILSLTRALGNVSLVDVLVDFARNNEKDQVLLEEIEFIGKFFDRCRENRNDLMHSTMIIGAPKSNGAIPPFEMVKPVSPNARQEKVFRVELAELRSVADSIDALGRLLVRLAHILETRKNPDKCDFSLRDLLELGRPSMPNKLSPLPPEKPHSG